MGNKNECIDLRRKPIMTFGFGAKSLEVCYELLQVKLNKYDSCVKIKVPCHR
jgi:hypothetical protein